VKNVIEELGTYSYEHIFIDNASKDKTVSILKEIAKKDKNVKIIINARNFGHIRSPYHAILQAKGDAVISIAADLQDPPSMIADFIKNWEEGYKIVVGVKSKSEENPVIFAIRKLYYNLIEKFADTKQIKNFTGFGLYDREFVNILREIDEPYPYFRGLITEMGFERAEIEFIQPKRKKGKTKNNFYTLYDMAMLGFVSHSKVPLRMATFIGFSVATFSLLVALGYLIYKLVFWQRFQLGMAPMVIGVFFFAAVQLFFIGIIGEYIGAIYTQVKNRPLVIEKERINFELDDSESGKD
jgi:glycosyltransferase involved in cell wall biosynthesis